MALAVTASSTGWISVGELLMTRKTSLVAVCWSSASVRSPFLACSSLSSRAFSIAITAWSANVRISVISPGAKPPVCSRVTAMTPTTSSPRSIGTQTPERKPRRLACSRNQGLQRGSVSKSGACSTACVTTA